MSRWEGLDEFVAVAETGRFTAAAERLGLSKNMVEKYMIRTLRHLRDRLDASAP